MGNFFDGGDDDAQPPIQKEYHYVADPKVVNQNEELKAELKEQKTLLDTLKKKLKKMKLNLRMIIKHSVKKIFNNYAILQLIFHLQIFQITKILFV